MTAVAMIETAALMGVFVLTGGLYGLFYSIGRLRARPGLVRLGRVFCVAALLCAAAIGAVTPLGFGWKLLIAASAGVYIIIPPVTWRLVERQHAEEELSR
ncbi:MAG: hypothetical protein EPN41_13415 [Candidimonas sp.]|nr:MAG: hypothetical protein EPN41_13415 [Candidimonas sp.]